MGALWTMFQGKRAYLCGLGLAILGVIYQLDLLLHDNPDTKEIAETAWFTIKQYEAAGYVIGGGAVAALRAGISGTMKK